MKVVSVGEETVYLYSADSDVVCLLRHMVAHFAAERIELHHLLDWKYFAEKNSDKIDCGHWSNFPRR